MNKDWNIFLNFVCEVAPMLFENNLRIDLDSKLEKFKNIEAAQKVMNSFETMLP